MAVRPERLIVLMAVSLAALEKLARSLARVGVIWATVVLIGGYVNRLAARDFVLISVVLLVEGSRIFFLHHKMFPSGPPVVILLISIFIVFPISGFVFMMMLAYVLVLLRRIRRADSKIRFAWLQALFIGTGQVVFAPIYLPWKALSTRTRRAAALSMLFSLPEFGLKYLVTTIRSASQALALSISITYLYPRPRSRRFRFVFLLSDKMYMYGGPEEKNLELALKVFFSIMVVGQSLSVFVDAILVPLAASIRDWVGRKKFIAKGPVVAFFYRVYQVSLKSQTLNEGLKMTLVEFLLDNILQSHAEIRSGANMSNLEVLQVLNAMCESDNRPQMSRSGNLIHYCLLVHKYRSLERFKLVELQSLSLLVNLSSNKDVNEEEAVLNVVMKILDNESYPDYLDYLTEQNHGTLELGMLQMKLLLLLSTYPLQHTLGTSYRHKAIVAGSILLKLITNDAPSDAVRDLIFNVFVTDSFSRTECFASQQDDFSLRAIHDKVALWQDGKKDTLLAKLGMPTYQTVDIVVHGV